MDPALLTTYTAVLATLQRRCKGDTSSASTDELDLMSEYLTEAMGWAWKFPGEPWPVTKEGLQVDLVNGVIVWGTVHYANWWQVYNKDPRPFTPEGQWEAYRVRARRDADGIWPLGPFCVHDTPPTSLFVYFQRRAPEFTMTLVLPNQAYAVGDVVYDGASGKTGDCYRSLAAQTTPAPPDAQLADITKWERQEIPRFLRDAVLLYAKGNWQRDKSKEDKTGNYETKAHQMLENEWFDEPEEG